MFNLGFSFGKLIYLLDAFEDYEKDFHDGKFNAFKAAFQNGCASDNVGALGEYSKLNKKLRLKCVQILGKLADGVLQGIEKLPLEIALKQLFAARLNRNIEHKLKTALPVVRLVKSKVCAPRRRLTLTQRWSQARETAKELTARNFAEFSWKRSWKYLPAFLMVAAIAFIAPQEAAKAKSWQDCAELNLNLMFISSLVGAVLALPMKMAANLPPNPLAQFEEEERRRKWSDYLPDCCSDCAEGCTECCCECSCESCCNGCSCCDGCDCGCDC